MTAHFGNTWWSKKWLEALYSIDVGGRLARGKNYANTGHVKSIHIDGTVVTAKVKGSARAPYNVVIKFKKLDELDGRLIIHEMTYNRTLLSSLLNNELPETFPEIFTKTKMKIFIESWGEIAAICSCPDYAMPCKHIAAVMLMLSAEIDRNPLLVFTLRGVNIEKEMKNRGVDIANIKEKEIPSLGDLTGIEDEINYQGEQQPLPDMTHLEPVGQRILAMLTNDPVFYRKSDFKLLFTDLYEFMMHTTLDDPKHSVCQTKEFEVKEIVFDDVLSVAKIELASREQVISVTALRDVEKLTKFLEHISINTIEQHNTTLQFLFYAYHFAHKLITTGAFIPAVYKFSDNYYIMKYLPYVVVGEVKKIFTMIVSRFTSSPILVRNHVDDTDSTYPVSISAGLLLTISMFIEAQVKTFGIKKMIFEDKIEEFFFKSFRFRVEKFYDTEIPYSVHKWLSKFKLASGDFIPVLKISEENDHYVINYEILLKNETEYVPFIKIMYHDAYATIRLEAIKKLGMIAEYYKELQVILDSNGDAPLTLDAVSFAAFFENILPLLTLLGVELLLPRGMREVITPALRITATHKQGGGESPGYFSFGSMVQFDYEVALGSDSVDPETFLAEVRDRSGLIKIRDRYIHVNHRMLEKIAESSTKEITVTPECTLQTLFEEEHNGVEVVSDETVATALAHILDNYEFSLPQNLHAELREYQKTGFQWLARNHSLKMGSILADDMGLGKTIQTITFLLYLQENNLLKNKALIIVPTGLLTNWEKEIDKYAPNLRYYTYYGEKRALASIDADVVLSTYGIMKNDIDLFCKKEWALVVFDEAQNLKNPSTDRTLAALKLRAECRIALSGTPVENRMLEFWSIMHLVNRGYLGSMEQFRSKFALPIEKNFDAERIALFQKVTAPFFLRRMKNDRSIIQELPEKIEIDEFALLSKEQAKLYQSLVDTSLEDATNLTGITRQGLIFKLLTGLKQICNHPAHYTKSDDLSPSLSGKVSVLMDLLDDIYASGNKVLIFTQFKEMGDILKYQIQRVFKNDVLFMHGGLSRTARDAAVDDFQNKNNISTMILTIKAGGTGLNLTAASYVIHFDLWWNPAVEAQATDRAYRIGQTNNVMVYRLITKGTFEEKIDGMLKNKKELASLTVESGENWIGEMSNDELREIFTLK